MALAYYGDDDNGEEEEEEAARFVCVSAALGPSTLLSSPLEPCRAFASTLLHRAFMYYIRGLHLTSLYLLLLLPLLLHAAAAQMVRAIGLGPS